MAAGKWKVFDFTKKYIGDGTLDLDDTTNWKIGLAASTSNINNVALGTAIYADITNELATANGYTLGGGAVTGVTWTRSGSTLTFDCDNFTWTAAGGSITARFGFIYKNATVNTIVKPLLCWCLLDTTPADVTATDTNTFTITMNASGLFTLTGATTD